MEEIPFGSPERPQSIMISREEAEETYPPRAETYTESVMREQREDALRTSQPASLAGDFVTHCPPVRRNKGREVRRRRRRRQALKDVRNTLQTAAIGIPHTQEAVMRCGDCGMLADPYKAHALGQDFCQCSDMDEALENAANNGTKQNPASIVRANVSRETLMARRERRLESRAEEEREAALEAEGRSIIERERAALRAKRAE